MGSFVSEFSVGGYNLSNITEQFITTLDSEDSNIISTNFSEKELKNHFNLENYENETQRNFSDDKQNDLIELPEKLFNDDISSAENKTNSADSDKNGIKINPKQDQKNTNEVAISNSRLIEDSTRDCRATEMVEKVPNGIKSQLNQDAEHLLELLFRIREHSSINEQQSRPLTVYGSRNAASVLTHLSEEINDAEILQENAQVDEEMVKYSFSLNVSTEETSLSSLNLEEQIILEAPEEFRSENEHQNCNVNSDDESLPKEIDEGISFAFAGDETSSLRGENQLARDRDCHKASTAEGSTKPRQRHHHKKLVEDTRENVKERDEISRCISNVMSPASLIINNHVNCEVVAPTNNITMEIIEDRRHGCSIRPGGASEDNDQTKTVTSEPPIMEIGTRETAGPFPLVLLNNTAVEIVSEKMTNAKVDGSTPLHVESKQRENNCASETVTFMKSDDVECAIASSRTDAEFSQPSIESDAAVCAQAPRCSRVPTAWICAAPGLSLNEFENSCNDNSDLIDNELNCNEKNDANGDANTQRVDGNCVKVDGTSPDSDLALLKWEFRNGRLVFEDKDESGIKSNKNSDCFVCSTDILSSKCLNKKRENSRSRIKYLEKQLKKVSGFFDDTSENETDEPELNEIDFKIQKSSLNNCEIDKNQNVVLKTNHDEQSIGDDQVDFCDTFVSLTGVGGCEFDVNKVGSFKPFNSDDFYVVYDEYDELSCSSDDKFDCLNETPVTMGTDGDKVKQQHNPDHENLKSLLKKPGRGKDNGSKHRVVFNENKNEFFDADYIILIREECDYDDEDEDSVCTCNDHEMVRLTCCEPNCNCTMYENYPENTPPSPKFAPPFEFVDSVTLSPPEGYKDLELGEHQLLALQHLTSRGRAAVCRDCSQSHEDDGKDKTVRNPEIESDCESDQENRENEVTQKTDQSQQTTPTTPPADSDDTDGHYFVETSNIINENNKKRQNNLEQKRIASQNNNANFIPSIAKGNLSISGILKGGRLWKQQSHDNDNKSIEIPSNDSNNSTSDEENNSNNKRSVRFTEISELERDNCDGASDRPDGEDESVVQRNIENQEKVHNNVTVSPESTEMTLTFKLGNHFLVSNNSLKPNSAVRQLFPCSKPLTNVENGDNIPQYLVTTESLRAFEENKRSKLPLVAQNEETDESIKKAIERNTLRRSLIRYEPRTKRKEQKPDNSLVERIKQLTCDVDDNNQEVSEGRLSPPGEESNKIQEDTNVNHKFNDKSFSPSSSSSSSSNSSTYKKITDLFHKKDRLPDIQMSIISENGNKNTQTGPEIVNFENQNRNNYHQQVGKVNSSSESRKQFLSSLAPLTACVGGYIASDDQHANRPGTRSSVTSSVGTEYSLEDIDEGLRNGEGEDLEPKRVTPDVVAGTPSNETADELAMFVQQDAGRIERIKKKYQTEKDEDDEHDDYGFNKRPNVRGIKPKFGTTTEILQQIQNHMQASPTPLKTTNQMWPYYSETSLSNVDIKQTNINQSHPSEQFNHVPDEAKYRTFPQVYRPSSFGDNNIYQNCVNQQCTREAVYKTNINHVHPVMRIGGGCGEAYQPSLVPKDKNGRPESPPPLDMARSCHQTMVYIPYNYLENYQSHCVSPNAHYVSNNTAKCYPRTFNQNQVNERCSEMYQKTLNYSMSTEANQYQGALYKQGIKPPLRVPFPSSFVHHPTHSRCESPVSNQILTARSTQTPCSRMPSCGSFYPTLTAKFRPTVGTESNVTNKYMGSPYGTKINRQNYAISTARYPAADNISFTDSESQYSTQIPTIYRQYVETTFSAQPDTGGSSPTKQRFIERGVPEGAASAPSQDSSTSQSTMTSPTSPQQQNIQSNPKPLFYAMNV